MSRLTHKIICGHVLDVLKTMPDESVDTIVTSPPYWGLRDYGEETNTIWGGNSECEHDFSLPTMAVVGNNSMIRGKNEIDSGVFAIPKFKGTEMKQERKIVGAFCKKCGAWYGQLGLEPTLDLYLVHLWQITDELYRVLKKTGIMFWNHGDCYSGSGKGYGSIDPKYSSARDTRNTIRPNRFKIDIPQKCMCLQNYRFVLGLIDIDYRILVEWRAMGKPEGKLEEMLKYPRIQEILRNSIIWHKPNHMPESVKDRFTNAYEPVFMLTKSKKYWFDLDAVREPHKEASEQRVMRAVSNSHKYINHPRYGGGGGLNKPRPNRRTKIPADVAELFGSPRARYHREQNMRISQYQYSYGDYLVVNLHPLGKNPGNVWQIPTQPFSEAHFATFPEKLIEPLIKCGCPEWICKKCGKPRVRIVEGKSPVAFNIRIRDVKEGRIKGPDRKASNNEVKEYYEKEYGGEGKITIGWTDCGCGAGWEAGVVLDPFAGSGTVGVVAERLGRDSILIDLNKEYCEMAYRRLKPLVRQMKLDREPSIIERIGF